MDRIPSKKRLIDAFGQDKGSAIRTLFEKKRERGMSFKLGRAGDILGGDGVEYVHHRGQDIYYVNMGDPYITTLLRVNGKLRIGDWGSLIER